MWSSLTAQPIITEFMASNQTTIADPDLNAYVDWIELFNSTDTAILLKGYSLTDEFDEPKKWEIQDSIFINSREYLLFWADDEDFYAHTNFKLDKDGEGIWIFNVDGEMVDGLNFPQQSEDVSYGRDKTFSTWKFFETPTPGLANDSTYLPVETNIQNSHEPGFYKNPILLELTLDGENDNSMFYTLDGSLPDTSDRIYSQGLIIDTTTVLKAITINTKGERGKLYTGTFFIQEHNSELPVISLSAEPDYFFDDSIGIYVVGKNGITGYCNNLVKRNYCQDWERSAYIEWYDSTEKTFSSNCGVKIHGNCSRNFPQRSLALFARKIYGEGSFKNQFFADKPFEDFESIILRNSGNDNRNSMFRDALMASIVKDQFDLDYQAYQPSVLYVNGVYWGMYNLREKLNEHYVASNAKLNAEQIDLIEGGNNALQGDLTAFNQFFEELKTLENDNTAATALIKNNVDVIPFFNYMISEIYCANTDWPVNNVKLWRERLSSGKWRWILYDTDVSFNLSNATSDRNNFYYAAYIDEDQELSYYFTPYLFKRMLQIHEFQHLFLQQYSQLLNTTFLPQRVLNVIDSIKQRIEPEIPFHGERWDLPFESWKEEVNKIKDFAIQRNQSVHFHAIDYFGNENVMDVIVRNPNPEYGSILINNIMFCDSLFQGVYLLEDTVLLTAIPNSGYRFSHWEIEDSDTLQDHSDMLTLSNIKESRIVPFFVNGYTSVFQEKEQAISIYPNPAQDWITINTHGHNKNEKVSLAIYSIDGRLIQYNEIKILHDSFHVDLNNLPPAIYTIQLKIKNAIQTIRLIVTQN